MPTTETIATSARPTISAEAVEAVRRGFLLAFSRAKLPDALANRVIGQPKRRDAGLAISVLKSDTEMNSSNAPAANKLNCLVAPESLAVPKPVAKRPLIPKMRPITVRRLLPPDQRLRSSLKAAIGGIFEARLAGEIAARRVTPMPTTAAATQVRVPITRGPSGRPDPSPA